MAAADHHDRVAASPILRPVSALSHCPALHAKFSEHPVNTTEFPAFCQGHEEGVAIENKTRTLAAI
jgi:hypothetical protein